MSIDPAPRAVNAFRSAISPPDRTTGPHGRCRRRGRSFREDGHESSCRLVGVPASVREGLGIECGPFKVLRGRHAARSGRRRSCREAGEGPVHERGVLAACLPWVKAQRGDQLDFGRTPTAPAIECRSVGAPPSAPLAGVVPTALGGREPVFHCRQGGAGPFNATVRPYARRSRVRGISPLEPVISLLHVV